MASRARPPNRVERPNGQPGRSTGILTQQTRSVVIVADGGDGDGHVSAEAAEQLAWDWHIADEREYPTGLEHCACSCPRCAP